MNGWRSVTAQCCFFLFLLSNTVFRSWLSEGTCYWCAQFVLPGCLLSGWAQINLSQSQWAKAKANAGSFQVEFHVSFLFLLMLFSSSALLTGNTWAVSPTKCPKSLVNLSSFCPSQYFLCCIVPPVFSSACRGVLCWTPPSEHFSWCSCRMI